MGSVSQVVDQSTAESQASEAHSSQTERAHRQSSKAVLTGKANIQSSEVISPARQSYTS